MCRSRAGSRSLAVQAVLVTLFCCLLSDVATARKPVPNVLFGGWYLDDLDGPVNGSLSTFTVPNTNYMILSFVDPSNMILPQSLINMSRVFSKNHTVLVSIGGESFADKWTWLNSSDSAQAMAKMVAGWAQYPIDGIDIDAEDAALNYPPENMAIFLQEVKQQVPDFLITLCVYGSPEGRDFDNYLINNHLNGNGTRLIDWIHIMAYSGYTLDVTYIENYTKAPRSPWDHPIDQGVANSSVVIGMKGTKGFDDSSCDPTDYMQMAQYVHQVGLRGIGIWAFLNTNGNVTIPWFDPTCVAGYYTLCQQLLASPSCGQAKANLRLL